MLSTNCLAYFVASRFFRPLASFTSIPHPSHWGWGHNLDGESSTRAQTISMSIAVLTKDGELDMQTLHDTPVPQWSARGELSVSSGKGYKVYQPKDGEEVEDMIGSLSGLSVRGRDKKLGQQGQSNLHSAFTHGQPSRSSSLKRFPFGVDVQQTPRPGALTLVVEKDITTNESRGRTAIAADSYSAKVPNRGAASAAASRSRRSGSKGKLTTGERTSRRAVINDVSMVMKRRAIKGYGVDSVGFPSLMNSVNEMLIVSLFQPSG